MSFVSMDKNGTMTISWNEWSDYPVVKATENIPEIILYWKHSTVWTPHAHTHVHLFGTDNKCQIIVIFCENEPYDSPV